MRPLARPARLSRLACTLALVASVAGCATVRPWQRETLAARAMQSPPCAGLVRREALHITAVREASRGGYGVVGGGCGCN